MTMCQKISSSFHTHAVNLYVVPTFFIRWKLQTFNLEWEVTLQSVWVEECAWCTELDKTPPLEAVEKFSAVRSIHILACSSWRTLGFITIINHTDCSSFLNVPKFKYLKKKKKRFRLWCYWLYSNITQHGSWLQPFQRNILLHHRSISNKYKVWIVVFCIVISKSKVHG